MDGKESEGKNDQTVKEKTADFPLFLPVVYRRRLEHEIGNQVRK